MGEVTDAITSLLTDFQTYFVSILPEWITNFLGLFLLVLVIVIYSIFVWKLYRYVSKKNLIELNLGQYSHRQNPLAAKTMGIILYVVEYILLLPFLIFIWFGIFTLFLIILTEELPVATVLIISATVIGAVRMTAYYKEDISRELAKLLPFTLLAVSMTKPGFFNFSRVLQKIGEIPQFFDNIINYLIFIIALEIILRFFEFMLFAFGLVKKGYADSEEN